MLSNMKLKEMALLIVNIVIVDYLVYNMGDDNKRTTDTYLNRSD